MKALAKNPDNRYQSAAEMRSDIQRALQGGTVAAPPVLAEPMTQPIHAISEDEEPKRKKGAYIALILGVWWSWPSSAGRRGLCSAVGRSRSAWMT